MVSKLLLLIAGCLLPVSGHSALQCPEPFVPIANRCLYLEYLVDDTWGNMRSKCHLLEGELAKIDSAEVLSELALYIDNHGLPTVNYWVGASDELLEAEWVWTDGSPVTRGVPLWYHCGSSIQPNGGVDENCGCLVGSHFYFMEDEKCSAELYGICETSVVGRE